MIQTEWVISRLRQQWSDLEVAVEHIRTTGDRVTHLPLSQLGGDGVFVKEIERALHEHRIDLAVHSLKDLPTAPSPGLCILVAGPREDVRDVLVAAPGSSVTPAALAKSHAMPLRIGTCSLRRTAQVLALSPSVHILPLRGNVDTRLRKLEAGEYDGIVLAAAGLHRMEMQGRLAERLSYFPVATMMPAPGQGALALEICDEPEMRTLVAPLNDPIVQAATSAERMFMRHLGAGCYLPVAAHAEVIEQSLTLQAVVISLDGQRRIHVRQAINWTPDAGVEYAELLGVQVAEQALLQGAGAIIRDLDTAREQVGQDV
jgi:hydroxymethylbilane synthase